MLKDGRSHWSLERIMKISRRYSWGTSSPTTPWSLVIHCSIGWPTWHWSPIKSLIGHRKSQNNPNKIRKPRSRRRRLRRKVLRTCLSWIPNRWNKLKPYSRLFSSSRLLLLEVSRFKVRLSLVNTGRNSPNKLYLEINNNLANKPYYNNNNRWTSLGHRSY